MTIGLPPVAVGCGDRRMMYSRVNSQCRHRKLRTPSSTRRKSNVVVVAGVVAGVGVVAFMVVRVVVGVGDGVSPFPFSSFLSASSSPIA